MYDHRFCDCPGKRWILGIVMAKMITSGRSSMHQEKTSQLSNQWGPVQSASIENVRAVIVFLSVPLSRRCLILFANKKVFPVPGAANTIVGDSKWVTISS